MVIDELRPCDGCQRSASTTGEFWTTVWIVVADEAGVIHSGSYGLCRDCLRPQTCGAFVEGKRSEVLAKPPTPKDDGEEGATVSSATKSPRPVYPADYRPESAWFGGSGASQVYSRTSPRIVTSGAFIRGADGRIISVPENGNAEPEDAPERFVDVPEPPPSDPIRQHITNLLSVTSRPAPLLEDYYQREAGELAELIAGRVLAWEDVVERLVTAPESATEESKRIRQISSDLAQIAALAAVQP